MNISKVYYEELKSKCVNGKWESVRIGAEVSIYDTDFGHKESGALGIAKDFVKESIKREMGNNEKQKELLKALEGIRVEINKII